MVRVPEQLKDISEPRHDLAIIGPFIAFGEGILKICFFLPIGILMSWLYVAEIFTDNVVVPRYFEFVGQGFELISKKGFGGIYNQVLYVGTIFAGKDISNYVDQVEPHSSAVEESNHKEGEDQGVIGNTPDDL